MSSSEAEQFLSKLVNTVATGEQEVETARINLSQQSVFEPFQAFRRIDKSGNGYLNDSDLSQYLKEAALPVSERELQYIFQSSSSLSYKIPYNDFLNQVLPSSNLDLRTKCLEKHAPYSNKAKDDDDVRRVDKMIAEIYRKEIEYHRRIEDIKGNHTTLSENDLSNAFKALCNPETGLVNFKSLESFMKAQHYQFSREDYENVMRRIDKSHKGKVNFIDFRENLLLHKTLQAIPQPKVLDQFQPEDFEDRSSNAVYISDPNVRPSSASKFSASKLTSASKAQRESPAAFFRNKSPQPISTTTPFLDEEIGLNKALSPIADSGIGSGKMTVQDNSSVSNEMQPANLYQNTYSAMNTTQRQGPGQFYSEQVNAIRNNPIYQTTMQRYYNQEEIQNPANPLENRYQDPNYQSYTKFNQEHNTTIGPQMNNYRQQTTNDVRKYQNFDPNQDGAQKPGFYNPSFVDQAHKPDMSRYPENPFKHTDHSHYFKNYYANLKTSYYDQHYKGNPADRLNTKPETPSNFSTQRLEREPKYITYGTLKQQAEGGEPLKFYPTKYSQQTDRNNYSSYSYMPKYQPYDRNKISEDTQRRPYQPIYTNLQPPTADTPTSESIISRVRDNIPSRPRDRTPENSGYQPQQRNEREQGDWLNTAASGREYPSALRETREYPSTRDYQPRENPGPREYPTTREYPTMREARETPSAIREAIQISEQVLQPRRGERPPTPNSMSTNYISQRPLLDVSPRADPKSYTPLSKMVRNLGMDDNKPKSAMKIEEPRLIRNFEPENRLENKRSYSSTRLNNPNPNPIVASANLNPNNLPNPITWVDTANDERREIVDTSINTKPYKFRNNQYENLWGNSDE